MNSLRQATRPNTPELRIPFQAKPDEKQIAGDGTNVYLNARREWNERYGSYIAREKAWRLTAILALSCAVISITGVIFLASQNRLVPYVVAVDKLGSVVTVRRADVAAAPDERVIRAQLARWIQNVRSVYTDAGAERTVINEAYAMVNQHGPAYNTLNEFFKANQPFERAKAQTVGVEVESVLPITGNTWRVEWMESIRGRDGSLMSKTAQQASITVSINPPTDEATILLNPMGIYVDSYSWSQRL
jgi:type IV secretory pathway TrbF-like protein